MVKRMLIDALHAEETRVVIADENQIYDFDFVSTSKKQMKGNIYLAKITRVEPSLQAAFVEYGGGKQGFLPFAEIHPDYYQIPMSDRQRLMQEAANETPEQAADDEARSAEQNAAEEIAPQQELHEEQAELPASDESAQAHPAYLMEGAIDESVSSEEIEQPQGHEQIEAAHPLDAAEPVAAAESFAASEGEPAKEAKSEEGVETLASEDEEMQARPKKNLFARRYKIQEVIRRGQVVLVQVIKEERGNKGVSLTTFLSLAGRYCVLMPNSPKDGGISRKIMSPEDRKRLKAITNELRLANGMSVIIRTAGMDRTRAEIKRDYDYLVKVWNRIREDTLRSNAPALIYEESNLIKRAIRDQYTSDIDELIIEGDEAYRSAKEFMKLLLPSHTSKIKHYKEPTPLFYGYNIEDQLLSMHDPVVKLKSGGYIVINPTEALISIDVNSGRSTGERNIEETAAKTNLEAANEVARQLRLRDLAGLIVIDFIDMLESRNRRNVERALKDALKLDRAKIQLGRISPFGLLEMSRQRLRPSISETNMISCPHCMGRGFVRSNESMSIQMIRAIEKEASSGNWGVLKVLAAQEIALHLLNSKRDILRSIEERYGIIVQVMVDGDLSISEFNMDKVRRAQNERGPRGGGRGRNERPRNDAPYLSPEPVMDDLVEDEAEEPAEITENADGSVGSQHGDQRPRNRGRNRRRRGGRRPGSFDNANPSPEGVHNPEQINAGEPAADYQGPELVTDASNPELGASDEARPRHPRQRGGRGRRRWRDRNGNERGPNPNGATPVDGTSTGANDAPHEPQPQYQRPSQTDAHSLPSFATEAPVMPQPEPIRASAQAEAPRDPASSKKGWWQKMIDLDD